MSSEYTSKHRHTTNYDYYDYYYDYDYDYDHVCLPRIPGYLRQLSPLLSSAG